MWVLNLTWDLSHMSAPSLFLIFTIHFKYQKREKLSSKHTSTLKARLENCIKHAVNYLSSTIKIKSKKLVVHVWHSDKALYTVICRSDKWRPHVVVATQCVFQPQRAHCEGERHQKPAVSKITCLHNICRQGRNTQPNITCGETGKRQCALHSN